MQLDLAPGVERRKLVRLKVRADLNITPQKYEGKTHYVVKDPVSLRYYRFNEQEYFVVQHFDGKHTMEETQKDFEKEFRPQRLTHEDLEGFARQLLTAGLVQHESSRAADELLQSRRKQRRLQRIATFTNILYIKIPVIDPDRLLAHMYRYLWWIFTWAFFTASVALMISAVFMVATHYQTFYDKLPYYHQFFEYQTVLYMWLSLGIVKVIHEFGHGLSCKAYGGECHEMGALFMCLSPALYCNVSDSWTVANKWKRIIISFAGIYVELIIAAIATWVWWYTPGRPFVNNIALCLMTLCSISTFVFNANPLMRFDGYYMLADWLEIPNLRDRCNRYLKNLMSEHCLGIEVQPEPYMALNRRILFVVYAVVSYIYRWVVTFSIIYTLSNFLKPYKLGALSNMLALVAVGSMVGWPLYRMIKGIHQRGRLPDMKRSRVTITSIVAFALVLAFFLLPLPISRVRDKGYMDVEPTATHKLTLPNPTGAELVNVLVDDGEFVDAGRTLMVFHSNELDEKLERARQQRRSHQGSAQTNLDQARAASDPAQRSQLEALAGIDFAVADGFLQQERMLERQIQALTIKAPVAGCVMGPPKREEIGRFWEDPQAKLVCQIAQPDRLKILVPVAPHDYALLRDELEAKAATQGDSAELPVTIRVPGRGMRTWQGRVTKERFPTADAKTVPQQLTFKGGGTLATKPTEQPNVFIPQSQVYLVEVEVLNPDRDTSIRPGLLPMVKIHCQWRSAAWWTWRRINVLFDLGMM